MINCKCSCQGCTYIGAHIHPLGDDYFVMEAGGSRDGVLELGPGGEGHRSTPTTNSDQGSGTTGVHDSEDGRNGEAGHLREVNSVQAPSAEMQVGVLLEIQLPNSIHQVYLTEEDTLTIEMGPQEAVVRWIKQ